MDRTEQTKPHDIIKTIVTGVAKIHGIDWRLLFRDYKPGEAVLHEAKAAVTYLLYKYLSVDAAKELMKVSTTDVIRSCEAYQRNTEKYKQIEEEIKAVPGFR